MTSIYFPLYPAHFEDEGGIVYFRKSCSLLFRLKFSNENTSTSATPLSLICFVSKYSCCCCTSWLFFFFFLIFTPFYFDHPSSSSRMLLLLDWICPFLLLLLLKIVDNNNNRSQTIKKKLKFNQIDAHDPGFFIHNDRRVFFYFSEFRKIKKTMHACFQMKKKTKMLTTCAYDYQHDS